MEKVSFCDILFAAEQANRNKSRGAILLMLKCDLRRSLRRILFSRGQAWNPNILERNVL
ncbi:hypothetical protein HMPREF1322_0855 [Porphyromonas gingivalis W50]|nr:hypothetical protein PGA7_00014910 [Porphyromonas gingivalis]EIW91092.1 hypothetical protein HMPREF1322_0855 [Porphyromonas gingivalis W50]EOA11436.1 hypothetical protein A343_1944 [Porphyromonas gingivalis JCVI SC001]SJM17641.1 hypothetical protein PGIN_15-9_00593 [Porphyromonas gingivalis]